MLASRARLHAAKPGEQLPRPFRARLSIHFQLEEMMINGHFENYHCCLNGYLRVYFYLTG